MNDPRVEGTGRDGLGRVAGLLRQHDRFAVIGHVDPDLDSVGSALALTAALRALGKQAVAVSPDPPARSWSFLPGFQELVVGEAVPFAVDVAVVVDAELSEKRLGRAWPIARDARLRINVDHHDTNPMQAEAGLVEPEAAATGELIFRLVQTLGVPLSPAVAVPLYAAILTDTGSFRFANTRADTFRMAATLVEAGVDPAEVARAIYDTRPWAYLRLLGQLLTGLQRSEDGRVAWMELGRSMAEASGLPAAELDGLVQYARMVDGVEVALLFKELGPRLTRVSLRSQRYVDVSAIARTFGGGGHLRAAGCTLAAALPDAVAQVVPVAVAAARRQPEASRGVDGRRQPPAVDGSAQAGAAAVEGEGGAR